MTTTGTNPAPPAPPASPPAPEVPNLASAVPRGLDGRLETMLDGIVIGWAFDWSNPHRRVEVDVLVDGERVGATTADMLRPTLLKEGLGDGRHGFYVELPPRLRDGATHTIAVAFSCSGELLSTLPEFKSSASVAAEEWAGTSFHAGDAGGAAATRTRVLRLRPSAQIQFPRRTPAQGFTNAESAETIVLAEQVPVERCEPLHFSVQSGVADPESELRRRFGEHPADYLAERLLVSRLPGALVDTGSYLICPTERQFLTDSIRHPLPLPRWGYTHRGGNLFEREAEIEEIDERVVVLGAQTNPNFSHWLVESVLRALLFRPFDDGSVMYLSPSLAGWQLEALALAGVAQERILMVPEHRMVRFREVYAVSRGMSRLPWLIPGALSALAALATPKPPEDHTIQDHTIQNRRLFVSRALVRRRHTTNERELLAVLERHGFQTVHPQTLGVSEQIELFAGAEAIIGSWGSGLTNLIFSAPGTLVIEVQPEDVGYGGNAFVWNIASIRGQRFAQVVCPAAEGMRELPLGRRDMTVDVGQIDELLGELLA